MHYYKAFGFYIASEILLPQLKEVIYDDVNGLKTDIHVAVRDLSKVDSQHTVIGEMNQVIEKTRDSICFDVLATGRFQVSCGKNINVHTCDSVSDAALSLYIMGRCIGCILAQRGLFALHGSCVCKNGKAIVICGYSGAGKSTLAAEFLSQGWQLMADDIAVIQKREGIFNAVSSFPTQKLWQDAIAYYEYDSNRILPLVQGSRRAKFHIDSTESFFEGSVPLVAILKLHHDENECSVTEYFGMDKIKKIVRNIYLNRSMNDNESSTEALRFSVELSKEIRLFFVKRNNDPNCSKQIYATVLDALNEETHV